MELLERNNSGSVILAGIGVPVWKIDYLSDCGVSDKEIKDRYWLNDTQLQAAKDFASSNPIEMASEQDHYFSGLWEVFEQNRVRTWH